MFEHLAEAVNYYNSLGNSKAVLQKFDTNAKKAFILCVITGLMSQVYEKVSQAYEICYMDVSASFEPLNTSITLLYTSCTVGTLPLGLFITSNESEIILKKVVSSFLAKLFFMNKINYYIYSFFFFL